MKKFAKRFMGNDEVAKIARRYLVMNSFDGVLTILGVVVGTYMAEGFAHPSVVLSAGVGASLAMGVSGAMGTYLIERAERAREGTNGENESKKDAHDESLFLALVDGLSPALVTLIAVIPSLLALKSVISAEWAFVSSVTIIALELFGLGAFLGKISGKSVISHGLITLFVGAVVFLLVSALPF
jgi:predicted membrane protein (TIGR00267 family)